MVFLGLLCCCEGFGKVLETFGVFRGRFGKNKILKISSGGLRICAALVTQSGVKPNFFPNPKFLMFFYLPLNRGLLYLIGTLENPFPLHQLSDKTESRNTSLNNF